MQTYYFFCRGAKPLRNRLQAVVGLNNVLFANNYPVVLLQITVKNAKFSIQEPKRSRITTGHTFNAESGCSTEGFMNHTCSQLAGGKRDAIVEKESESRACHTQLKKNSEFHKITCQKIISKIRMQVMGQQTLPLDFHLQKNEPQQN
jgi:hypothetical protein